MYFGAVTLCDISIYQCYLFLEICVIYPLVLLTLFHRHALNCLVKFLLKYKIKEICIFTFYWNHVDFKFSQEVNINLPKTFLAPYKKFPIFLLA